MDLGNGVKLEMILIPAGDFLMWEPLNRGEQPRVRITKPFYLCKYLVTQEQWETVMGSNPSHFKGPQNPVERVSWDDCQQFLDKLNAKVGGGKFSLPSEAQWEYACRAGSTTKYCFGDDEARLGEYAWYRDNSGSKTHPVGEKKPNAWGLYDMHGNVWEWCQDGPTVGARYRGYLAKSHIDDPAGPATGALRVLRGGCWDFPAGGLRSGHHNAVENHWSRSEGVGFRASRVSPEAVAQTPPSESAAPLKLQPVHPQTIESGKPLAVAVSSENPDAWKSKLRYAPTSDARRAVRGSTRSRANSRGRRRWGRPRASTT